MTSWTFPNGVHEFPPVMDFDPREFFRLDPEFLASFEGKSPVWGPVDSDGRSTSPIGEVTFLRTYPAFIHELNRLETPAEVFARCTETVMGVFARRVSLSDGHWSPEKAQREGQELFRRMWALKVLPGGRMLANLGRASMLQKGAVCLNNCAFFSTRDIGRDLARPFADVMDYLMLGAGVGFDTRGGAALVPVLDPVRVPVVVEVQDTRESWCAAVARTFRAFRAEDTLPRWSFALLRRKGLPLRTFGGVSSGPGPLAALLAGLDDLLTKYIGAVVDEALIVDAMNLVGRCVVAGGVRRSSEIALGPRTPEFMGLKDPAQLEAATRALAAREREITATWSGAAPLAELRARMPALDVLGSEFARAQDEVDALEGERYALLSADAEWNRLSAEINAHPLRAWRWASNNSVLSAVGDDYRDIATRNVANGEPGLLWLDNVRRFGRMADGDLTAPRMVTPDTIPGLRPDPAIGCNPCQPDAALVLTPDGIRTYGDVQVGSVVWSGKRWTRVARKVATGIKPVFRYRTSAGSFLGTAEHRVVVNGVKVPVREADAIDRSLGPTAPPGELHPVDVFAGLMLGDGTYHGASRRNFLVQGEGDACYDASEIGHLLGEPMAREGAQWRSVPTYTRDPLPRTYERTIPREYLYGASTAAVRGFLRGLYAANGSVCGSRVTLKATSRDVIDGAQAMLSSIGIGSFVTTNPAREVAFANGTYECRESYDLNIGNATGRARFAELIGFLHPDKAARLAAVMADVQPNTRADKVTFDVTSVEEMGEMEVYDITVEAEEHTYWTNGLLVSNCGEIALEDGELCCLVETFPTRHDSVEDWIASLKYAYMIGKAVTDLPTHNARTSAVIARNRRIGVSITGIAGWYVRLGREAMNAALDRGYRELRRLDRLYSGWLGVPESLRLTTVKPSGTLSLLAGVEGGMRFPEAPHCIRIVRLHDTSPLIDRLRDAGFRIEPDRYAPHTVCVHFPVRDTAVGRPITDVPLWEQAQLQADVQGWWADNMVSATLMIAPSDIPSVPRVLAAYDARFKGCSMLPYATGVYAQPPYTPVTERRYMEENARVRPVDLSNLGMARDSEERFCDGGACALPG